MNTASRTDICSVLTEQITNFWSSNLNTWIVHKNAHMCIVAGNPVMAGLGGVLVEVLRATLSWQPWWRLRGRGERLNCLTSAEDSQ